MENKQFIDRLFFVGRIFSPLYGLVMQFRAWMYASGFFKSKTLAVPVICVGNLTMGGTGKTPMVIYLGKLLGGAYRAAVISRGYGGKLKSAVNVVSDGRAIRLSAEEAGDEPVLLAQHLPGVPVVTGVKRVMTGNYIVDNGLADLLIMDDGFQHMALHRDLNVVLFSAHSLLGNEWVFPGGELREPVSALQRADCFVLTGVDDLDSTQADLFREYLAGLFPQTAFFKGTYEPTELIKVWENSEKKKSSTTCPINNLQEVPLYGFCGIANPESFRGMLKRNFLLKGWQSFEDHHSFSESEMVELVNKAQSCGCKGIIMTEKDYVKIRELNFDISLPLWVLRVSLKMEHAFDQFVLQALDESVSFKKREASLSK